MRDTDATSALVERRSSPVKGSMIRGPHPSLVQ